jgi:hypothetical protein
MSFSFSFSFFFFSSFIFSRVRREHHLHVGGAVAGREGGHILQAHREADMSRRLVHRYGEGSLLFSFVFELCDLLFISFFFFF